MDSLAAWDQVLPRRTSEVHHLAVGRHGISLSVPARVVLTLSRGEWTVWLHNAGSLVTGSMALSCTLRLVRRPEGRYLKTLPNGEFGVALGKVKHIVATWLPTSAFRTSVSRSRLGEDEFRAALLQVL